MDLQNILDALELGVCALDQNGHVVFANDRMLKLFERDAVGTGPLTDAFPGLPADP